VFIVYQLSYVVFISIQLRSWLSGPISSSTEVTFSSVTPNVAYVSVCRSHAIVTRIFSKVIKDNTFFLQIVVKNSVSLLHYATLPIYRHSHCTKIFYNNIVCFTERDSRSIREALWKNCAK